MACDASGKLVRCRLRHANGETQRYEVGAFNQVLSASPHGGDIPMAWSCRGATAFCRWVSRRRLWPRHS